MLKKIMAVLMAAVLGASALAGCGSGGEASSSAAASGIDGQAGRKRAMKERYARQPLFWRSFAYFCYRYFLKLGFLDGREGFLWHFMQGWWYRTLVDARQFEKQKQGSANTER